MKRNQKGTTRRNSERGKGRGRVRQRARERAGEREKGEQETRDAVSRGQVKKLNTGVMRQD